MKSIDWEWIAELANSPIWSLEGMPAAERDRRVLSAFIKARFLPCSIWLIEHIETDKASVPPMHPDALPHRANVGSLRFEEAKRVSHAGPAIGASVGLTFKSTSDYRTGTTVMPGHVWTGLLARYRGMLNKGSRPTVCDRVCMGYAYALASAATDAAMSYQKSKPASSRRKERGRLVFPGVVASWFHSRAHTNTAMTAPRLADLMRNLWKPSTPGLQRIWDTDKCSIDDVCAAYLRQSAAFETALCRVSAIVTRHWGTEPACVITNSDSTSQDHPA